MDLRAEEMLETENLKHKKHPGIMNIKAVELPEKLVQAAANILASKIKV